MFAVTPLDSKKITAVEYPIAVAVPVNEADLESGGAVAFAVETNDSGISYQNSSSSSNNNANAADPFAPPLGKQPLTNITHFSVRNGFIRKVYGILAAQLLVTFAGTFLISTPRFGFSTDSPVNPIFTALYNTVLGLTLMIGCSIASFIFVCALACCPKVRRTYPTNYIVLSAFTLCQTVTLGMYASYFQTVSVAVCLALTMGVVAALTIYACTTKKDFTVMGGALVAFLFVFIMAGWLMPLFYFVPGLGSIAHVGYACIGAILFSFYIVYDTQLIVGGGHKYSYDTDEYVFAALNLYLDIINLFMYLLQIFGRRR